MKKLILIPIILLLCYSCSEKKSDNNFTAIIDGFSSDSISIKGGNLSKPLYRSNNNKFSTTIGSSSVNYYTLVIDSVEIPLYIEDGTSLKLHTSTHNLLNNLKFEGANSKINNYLIEKELALLELFKDEKAIYSLDQVKFKTKINNTISDFASKLDLLKDEFPNFVSAEKQYLEYDKHLFLLNFRYYHVQYTKDESFKLADDFMPQDYKNIVYNDSLAYNNSKSYNALALNNGMWKTLVKIGQDYNNLKPENLQEALDEIKFSALKNDVINRFSSSTLTPENPKMKEIYEIYVSESSNDEIDKKLKFPVVIKPINEGSSVHVYICTKKDFMKNLKKLNIYKQILIEEFIEGREIQVAVMGQKVLGTIELKPKRKFYDYEAKYSSNAKTKHIIPVDLSKKDLSKVENTANKAHQIVGCRGVSRSDFKFHKGKFYLLEINTQPGMTKLSLVPEIASHKGITFIKLIEWILKDASINR